MNLSRTTSLSPWEREEQREIRVLAPLSVSESRVVSYNERKTKNRFQSLSPLRGEVWRGVKIYGYI
jgi:hypothetical protein